MKTYQSPGVYIEEVNKGTKPIEAVGAAVAAFVGFTEFATDKRRDKKAHTNTRQGDQELLGKPTLVTNWSQFEQKFGSFHSQAFLPDSVYGYFANGGSRAYIISLRTVGVDDEGGTGASAPKRQLSIPTADDPNTPLLDVSVKPGVTGKVTVSVKPDGTPDAPSFTLTISGDGSEEIYPALTTDRGDNNVEGKVNPASKLVQVKVKAGAKAKLLPAEGSYPLSAAVGSTQAAATNGATQLAVTDYQGNLESNRGVEGLERFDDITMIAVPDLMTPYVGKAIDDKAEKEIQGIQQMIIDYCEKVRYCFAILDAPPGKTPQQMKKWRETGGGNLDSTRAAVYYPWLEVPNRTGEGGISRLIPPSGHMAGIYARSDRERGIHKAPANEVVQVATGVEIQVTTGEQDMLNPIGINCIRGFPGRGIRVWGARTLSSDASWRYINVRRLFNMVEASIEKGTQWVVFEPNDPDLWARVRRDVGAFLKLTWRSGALFGDTPEQAFYVKCDHETNPRETRDLGQLIIEIGMAPVKPAEFVIFRISQWAGPDATG